MYLMLFIICVTFFISFLLFIEKNSIFKIGIVMMMIEILFFLFFYYSYISTRDRNLEIIKSPYVLENIYGVTKRGENYILITKIGEIKLDNDFEYENYHFIPSNESKRVNENYFLINDLSDDIR